MARSSLGRGLLVAALLCAAAAAAGASLARCSFGACRNKRRCTCDCEFNHATHHVETTNIGAPASFTTARSAASQAARAHAYPCVHALGASSARRSSGLVVAHLMAQKGAAARTGLVPGWKPGHMIPKGSPYCPPSTEIAFECTGGCGASGASCTFATAVDDATKGAILGALCPASAAPGRRLMTGEGGEGDEGDEGEGTTCPLPASGTVRTLCRSPPLPLPSWLRPLHVRTRRPR